MPGSTLTNGERLSVGESLFSPDGSVELKIQDDGKFAIYWDGECRFQNTPEQRDDINSVVMQDDGNLVLYTHDNEPAWASDTGGEGDDSCVLEVQDDGNVVLYKRTAIWASNTSK
ncbi:hypothetical protein DRE_04786 [Drechslerella stenobrocha 248]|uniref:Bulb-type lectin domain-containing protein n=1 Tax=Drechslerella stenobrocha 248 TaxID=1043628 RepID=W7I1B3_9PEZI|nr:hypothetical protein DRE_04786 [Drechslerella stenobrocha 248]